MEALPIGLYESLLTEGLRARLSELEKSGLVHEERPLRSPEASDRIALHLGREVERALASVPEAQRLAVGIELARALLDRLTEIGDLTDEDLPVEPGRVLHGISERRPDGKPEVQAAPLTPLLDTTLLTNAPGEPGLWSQLRSEIASADSIDLVMAFIRRSGITPLIDALARHVKLGRTLRVLTTTYTGSTELKALEQLRDIGAEVRVSYDIGATRLHAKAWIFHRSSGYSTTYIGSSNLTHSAQVTGLEWNVRASQARNADVLGKVAAVFDAYWSGGDFVRFDPEQFASERDQAQATQSPRPAVVLSPVEVRLRPFQQRLLDLLEVSRRRGHRRNLLVAATGTGKTVMAAVDYARLARRLPRARLLFVAHREEILDQAMATFCHVLRDPSFGERWVGGRRPRDFDAVFASVQSLAQADLSSLRPEHFDVVVIDEFHHAAAPTYTRLLEHLQPQELLGLTATPERSDGLPVLHWFGDRIAAELRLWDAIDQQLLVPFVYYGIHDGMDLQDVPWRRGRGYDVDALTTVYTSNDAWARLVIQQVRRIADPTAMKCLGFCVSVGHARFMADSFTRHGIPSVAVSATTPRAERQAALADLDAGRTSAVFSVDLMNEGVDLPGVDTLLMLRPTESPTLFIQQLGRGLRTAGGKPMCTVLDFVGLHRHEFRFDRRLRALLGGTRKDVTRQVEAGFPYLPAGCHMSLDRKAEEVILRSLRESLPSRWPAKVRELQAVYAERPGCGLGEFLDESGLDLEDVYDGGHGWSDLLEDAGVPVMSAGPSEKALRKGVARLVHADDLERVAFYRDLAGEAAPPALGELGTRERRLVHMLAAVVTDQVISAATMLEDALRLLWDHPQVLREIQALMGVLANRIDHVPVPLAARPSIPLTVHARYTRIEILAAMGIPKSAKVASWQSGVFEAKDAGTDLLAITLDKSGSGFSPTTRYRDYALSPSLMHWESQAVTRADGPTGLRYRTHESLGRLIYLFVRLRPDDRAFWFLGSGRYRAHEGERPMAITWELDTPIPGDLYAQFAAAVA